MAQSHKKQMLSLCKIFMRTGAVVVSILVLSLQSALAETFQIRVLNAKTGKRVAGQRVSVLVKGTKAAITYKTDAEGNITVDIPASAEVFVATEWWVTCRNTGRSLGPFVPVEKVLQEGVTVQNTCGRARSETIKGKLIIFAKKASPLELFRKSGSRVAQMMFSAQRLCGFSQVSTSRTAESETRGWRRH